MGDYQGKLICLKYVLQLEVKITEVSVSDAFLLAIVL